MKEKIYAFLLLKFHSENVMDNRTQGVLLEELFSGGNNNITDPRYFFSRNADPKPLFSSLERIKAKKQ